MEDAQINFNSRKQGGEPEKAFVKTCKMIGTDFDTIKYASITFAIEGNATFTWIYNPEKSIDIITGDLTNIDYYEVIGDNEVLVAIGKELIESYPRGSDRTWKELIERDMCEQAEKRGQWRSDD